jgi:hypothetical protein
MVRGHKVARHFQASQ